MYEDLVYVEKITINATRTITIFSPFFFFFNNIHELGLGCVRIIYPMSYRLDIARWLDLVYIYSFFTIYYAVIRLRHICFTQKNIVV